MCNCKQLELWTNTTDYIICYGRDDILNCYHEVQWDTSDAERDIKNDVWRPFSSTMFSMRAEDDGTLEERYPNIIIQRPAWMEQKGMARLVATVEKWIAVCGRGILTSTEY